MSRIIILLLFIITTGIVACEKDISITPPDLAPKLVVDAQIESGAQPIVILSTSLNYFATIDTADLNKSFVRNAKVTLTDGTKTSQLKLVNLNVQGFKLVYYTNDPTNPSAAIIGAYGKNYQLTIELNGQTYSSRTTIPLLTKTIDSLWSKPVPNRPISDSFRVISAKITDPLGLGNYIRYYTKVNRADYLPGYNSVFDDNVIDGKVYSVDIPKGVDKNFPLERENYGFFKRGDTVSIKYSNIDKATYDFWRTWEYTYQSVGNPFSSPGVVIGNINNGALGAFCGYAVSFKNIIIPK
jgi:hypothetical protein